ncbi:MAG TPA: winged helix-turn-helix domain-containing protein [Solirubrobacterales bacterium]|nr:winged helix-turn-helix domain-containing protein [Solirubrobacterales bacterium]
MTQLTRDREPTAFGISARTAKALAEPWRIRILAAVSIKPLSPSQFVEEVGGDLTHISRCFRQLAAWGYIEIVEVRPGRRRGAALEHVYRAIRRAYFDTRIWESVARSKRDAVSRSVINSYQERIREALEAGTFDQDLDRHLSWDAVALDRRAWTEVGSRLDSILDSLAEHELKAANRLAIRGERILTTVGLAAFRSPGSPLQMLRGARRHLGPADIEEPGDFVALGPKLAKALSNPWRCKILSAVSIRPLSPSQFVEESGGSLTYISRCFRDLARWGYLEILEERKGGRHGGGIEKIYRSTRRPYFDTRTWEALPQIVRDEISQFFLDTYFDRITEAVEAGTFDADTDRHLSWKPVVIDRVAWEEIGQTLDETLAWLPELETESLERTQDAETLISTTVGLASFRSPFSSSQ